MNGEVLGRFVLTGEQVDFMSVVRDIQLLQKPLDHKTSTLVGGVQF